MNDTVKQRNKVLCDLLATSLFGAQARAQVHADDLDALYREARSQTVAAQVLAALPSHVTAHEVYGQWLDYAMRSMAVSARILYAHRQIALLMEQEGIPYVILKGATSASYYADPGARMMGDVDFLVHPEDMDRAIAAMRQAGYQQKEEKEEHHSHLVFKKDGVVYELHFRFSESQTSGEEMDELTAPFIRQAVTLELPDGMGRVCSLCPAHHGLVMLLHMKRHMTNSGMGLRHLCDWAVFVNHFTEEEFAIFRPLFEQYGLWRFAQALSHVCHRYLGISQRAWFGPEDGELCDSLMEYIVTTGNFGSKGQNFSRLFVADTHARAAGSGSQLFMSLKQTVMTRWPRSRHNPLLVAVGMVYFPLKYAVNMLLGRRQKINPLKVVQDGSTVNKALQQAGLFEKK